MTTIFDNIDEHLGERLVQTFQGSQRLDAAVGYFNLRGWGRLADEVETRETGPEPVARILVGMTLASEHHRFLRVQQTQLDDAEHEDEAEIDRSVARIRKQRALLQFRKQLMLGVPSEADYKRLRQMRDQLSTGKLRVKLFTRRPMHAKAYICHREDVAAPIVGYVGSSNLTMAGLKHQYELNVDVLDGDAATKLARWFDDRWDDNFSIDITDDLIELIDESWASEQPADPYLVYLKVCYEVSQEAREGNAEYGIPASMRDTLLEFQASAVQTLARRVVTKGGAMLGDVVGLGKTITAAAVALMLREDKGYSTLVICPKNLVKMWQDYLDTYEIFGKVVSYSKVRSELPELRRHQLVIIDESHTLRNDTRKDYEAIHSYIRDNDSKVLLLTATPYNKQYRDVANQLGLFIDEDDDLGLSPAKALAANPGIADAVDGKITTLKAFEKSEEPEDWRRLMSEHLVRRTRTFIRENYAEVDPDNNREFLTFADGSRFYFPERVARPLHHSFGDQDPARLMIDDETLATVSGLNLPRYGLIGFVRDDAEPTPQEAVILNDQATGSGHLRGFTRTSLFKRLSSCGYSFALSLRRHAVRNRMYLHAIHNDLELPVGTILESMVADGDEDIEDADIGATAEAQYEALAKRRPKSIRWVRPVLFNDDLERQLTEDAEAIEALLDSFGEIDHRDDSKIDALVDLLTVQHPDEKVLIFSEYKDTVDYVVSALHDRGLGDVVGVSGATNDPTAVAKRFSPKSNRRLLAETAEAVDDEIRVLATTDVLSEGQNLQDAHIVVMYDLPWAIIKLIQRAGRIDRVGQESEEVIVYSFLPDDGVEAVLDLRERIRRRLAEAAQAFGSDERFFGTEGEVATIHDLYNGRIDEETDGEVDAASFAYQVWQRAERDTPDLADMARRLPDLVNTTKAGSQHDPDCVVTYVKTERGFDGFGMAGPATNPGLLTVSEGLQLIECKPGTAPLDRDPAHFDLVKKVVTGPLKRPRLIAGQLRGTRKRIWNRLSGNLASAEAGVGEALEALYQLPLTAEAERRLKSALRERSNEDLADLLALLHRDNNLVIEVAANQDPIRIVSSVGISKP